MHLSKIFENNEKWVQDRIAEDPFYFDKLSKGQNPEYLYIGCSDSRVTAEEIMGLVPGEIFVHRNIANMVVSIDLNAMSVINYAIDHLKVKHVIVCGHYHCGGVKAAMQSKDMGILNPWLRNIRDVYRTYQDELNTYINEDDRYNRLIELNVQEQCINLIKTASVQKAHKEWGLLVHGWIFDVHSGKLVDLNIDFSKILSKIMEIYRLQ
ncbi:MAG: carbonic anhydrase [Saprospiraceae bacterium]|jgi:carbonic anhydrase|nr:carbonic anhydrase [Saprospiraceae bacterium]MBP6397673.1 carbonic anhydrase [Saprospiraceae bacterium]MBP9194648.1 carbonic anhydrase [Saprospiraceae bacterium]